MDGNDVDAAPAGPGTVVAGVVPATVVDAVDPLAEGRLRVRLPWMAGDDPGVWARRATLAAGSGHGTWFTPDPGDEVLVAFEAGDPERPYVVGALWGGRRRPPEAPTDDNTVRTIRTPRGAVVRLEDPPGDAAVTIETPEGRRVRLSDGADGITIESGDGARIEVGAAGITVSSAAPVRVEAATIRLAAGLVEVDSAALHVDGLVRCDTLITNAVVSASYTPGAGNVW